MSFIAGIIAFLGLTNGGVSTPNSTTATSSNPYNNQSQDQYRNFSQEQRGSGQPSQEPFIQGRVTTPPLHMENSGLVQAKWAPKIICNFKLHLARNNMTQEQGVEAFESTSYKGV